MNNEHGFGLDTRFFVSKLIFSKVFVVIITYLRTTYYLWLVNFLWGKMSSVMLVMEHVPVLEIYFDTE